MIFVLYLPMGYSAIASFCYGCLPIVFDKLLGVGGEDHSIDAQSAYWDNNCALDASFQRYGEFS